MSSPERRLAAKVVLLDDDDNVLMFRGGDPSRPDAGTWWFMPGGGLEEGETFELAARREVLEETGRDIGDPGPVVARREVDFRFIDEIVHAHEAYFVVRVARFEISMDGWTDLEKSAIVEHRWWDQDALASTTDTIYPEHLLELMDDYLAEAD